MLVIVLARVKARTLDLVCGCRDAVACELEADLIFPALIVYVAFDTGLSKAEGLFRCTPRAWVGFIHAVLDHLVTDLSGPAVIIIEAVHALLGLVVPIG